MAINTNGFASSLALSAVNKYGFNHLWEWSLLEAFLQRPSIFFLNLSKFYLLVTRNFHSINKEIIGVKFASSKNHKLEFSRINFQWIDPKHILSKCPGDMQPGGFPGQQSCWNCFPSLKLWFPGQQTNKISTTVIKRFYPR